MTKEMVLENLQKLVGTEFNANDIVCAFEDFEENGEECVYVGDSNNAGHDKIAYIDKKDATEFYFLLDKDNHIIEVWIR